MDKVNCINSSSLLRDVTPVSFSPAQNKYFLSSLIVQEWLLTVNSVEGVGIFFVGSLWSTDDLQHGALRLRGL